MSEQASDRVSGTGAGPARAAPARCVRELVRAAAGTGYVLLSPVEAEELLRGLVGRLVEALFAEPFRTRPGEEVGLALVAAEGMGPEMLGHTVSVLGSRLLSDLGADTAELRRRLAVLLGGVSAGYARGLRDRVSYHLESVVRAMDQARHVAEQAAREAEQRRWWEARHDPLTRLPNRMLLTERLAADITGPASGAGLGLCLFAVDNHGAINGSLGHDVMEALLMAVAHRLQERFGPAGHLLARTGSAEFAILATGMSRVEEVEQIARDAIATLDLPFAVGPHSLHVATSGAVVHQPVSHLTPAEVMYRAEITLGWASADGGGRWLRFDPARHPRELARWPLTAAVADERHSASISGRPPPNLPDPTGEATPAPNRPGAAAPTVGQCDHHGAMVGGNRIGTEMTNPAALAAELKILRKGRGIFATQVGERVGPALRALPGISDCASTAELRRGLGELLKRLAAELPDDLRVAALVALCLHPDARLPFHQERIRWLAGYLQRDERTARRRVDQALEQLAEIATAPAARCGPDPAAAWHWPDVPPA